MERELTLATLGSSCWIQPPGRATMPME
ncbi:unnamed protein product [Linum tenue]|uniref:Ribulose-1,5-bisphosphate carboxylase/oxygenase large subunit n=1 Tax=Linum tenue TaxID=586396 RepID=A0AAV0PDN4_9ROSI|nr:unnamed protein product [Linum tenue]